MRSIACNVQICSKRGSWKIAWDAYCFSAYSQPSVLYFGQYRILSEVCHQQGDSIGPLLFCNILHPLSCSLECTVSEIREFIGRKIVKIANFTHPSLINRTRSGWSLSNFAINEIFLETRMFRLSDGKEIMTLAFFILIQYQSVTDRRTDRRTFLLWLYQSLHSLLR